MKAKPGYEPTMSGKYFLNIICNALPQIMAEAVADAVVEDSMEFNTPELSHAEYISIVSELERVFTDLDKLGGDVANAIFDVIYKLGYDVEQIAW